MGNISLNASDKCDLIYNGFSGDFVAGGNELNFEGMNYSTLAENSLKFRANFRSILPSEIISLSAISFNDFYEEYKSTYEPYKSYSIEDLYFLQEKNERNFRRIASFADGIRLGQAAPVFFFHDKQILAFYRSIDLKWYKQQKLHHKLSFHNNSFLAWMPSANKTNLPSFIIPHLSGLIENRLTQKILSIKKRRKKTNNVSVKNSAEFLEFMSNEPVLKLNRADLEFIDIGAFINTIAHKEIFYSDLDTIKMRIWDLYYTLEFVKELKNKVAGNIINLKTTPFSNEII
jgi:hypothetical protein